MRYLITGGAGFIGSNFIEYLLEVEPDAFIIAYDKLTYAGNNTPTDPRVLFIHGDICVGVRVDRYVEMCDYIINFAAETHVDNSIADQKPFLQSNFVGVGVLLDAARRHNKPILQVSTDEVYGSIEAGWWTEKATLKPSSPYAASKAAADLLCLAHHKTYGTKVTISRCCNNYGPRQHPEKFLPKAILAGLQGGTMPIYAQGLNERQWIYVKDHCEALYNLIHFYDVMPCGRYGEVYNIGTKDIKTNVAMIIWLEHFVPPIQHKYVEDRLGHDFRYALNYDKIKELGWEPKTKLLEGLRLTAKWYKENYYTNENNQEV